jgi:hypothetical protein
MKLTKKNLEEIIDSDNELIGDDKYPTNGSNLDSAASNTTDSNTGKGHQPFRYDMLGRFGFTLMPFFENEEKGESTEIYKKIFDFLYEKRKSMLARYIKSPKELKIDYRKMVNDDDTKICDKVVDDIIGIIKPYIEKSLDELNNNLKQSISENKFIEGRVLEKKDDPRDIAKEKSSDNDVLDKKIKEIADLVNKLDKRNITKLKNLLEDE